ncbi:hypothetical protein FGW37_05255 [Streptomyces rectiverticillatus]|uniref:hypothetical protein n=1 Tax=Streptomyces rectiverticillatus TaxID=173860 RepID=UPI0015C2DC4C|nr:hypothetical protein [Streptomyces rectiverticillatus]QLE71088.1 hypothetical protein FGW37_05255 [Streptomyces rectiverticillatus]
MIETTKAYARDVLGEHPTSLHVTYDADPNGMVSVTYRGNGGTADFALNREDLQALVAMLTAAMRAPAVEGMGSISHR